MTRVTPLTTGLTSAEVKTLLAKHGQNQINSKKELPLLKLFFKQFTSPLVYILLGAGVITFFLREFTDCLVIFSAVLVNSLLGFYQEKRAQNTLKALRALITQRVDVIRDGIVQKVDSSEIVPGDLVVLSLGDRIPADGVLVNSVDFSVNEAILTGEAMPVHKKTKAEVFGGTIVASGKATVLITKTGAKTAIGKIGDKIETLEEEHTPLQQQLAKVARILAFVVAGLSFIIFVLGKLLDYPTFEIFITSVAVAVAAVPEGLVVTLTVILTLGMQNILRRKALVRKLVSAETLGSVSTICIDKTGTLTEGKLQVVGADFTDKEKGFLATALCNEIKDPIGVATWEWARDQTRGKSLDMEKILEENPRLNELPFSPERRMMATLHPDYLFVTGAPEKVLEKCRLAKQEKERIEEKLEQYALRGLRLVGFAYKHEPSKKYEIKDKDLKKLTWLGVLFYEDPVRGGVKEALRECRKAGIKVKVITGDFLPTALSVLGQLGLDGQEHSLLGEELEKMSLEELKKMIDGIVLFARTTPEQKLKIVQALKEKGEVVAMTGDGVNDALALKMADIGIVVGEASDVAKEAADMVLLDSNFSTIIYAVEEGRTIFENIKKVVLFLLSDAFTEIFLIAGSLILGLPLAVSAVQILWINLIEDTFPGMALAFEGGERDLMTIPPRSRGEEILDSGLKVLIFIIGIFLNIVLLGLYYSLSKTNLDPGHIQTMMFAALGIDSLFVAFSCRSLRKTIFQYSPFKNKVLTGAILMATGLLFMAVYLPPLQTVLETRPLTLTEWGIVLGLGVFSLLAIEGGKWLFFNKFNLAQTKPGIIS
ncbi:MAG: cation-translocating P-type ATPase [Patescibacteria group bacterium]|jgi:Ca2+-transporting ATPase